MICIIENIIKDYSVVDMNKVYYDDRIDDMIKEGIQQAVYMQIWKKFEAFFFKNQYQCHECLTNQQDFLLLFKLS